MAFLGITHAHGRELTGAAATLVVAAMVAVVFAGSTLVTPLYVIYERQLGFSRITLTLIYAAYVVGNLAALLFFGGWSDRIGRRQTALPAITVAIISALVFLFGGNVAALFVGRILSGLGIGLGAGTGTAWLAELIGKEDKTRATAIATSANFLGLGVGALVSGLLAQYTPWPLQLPFIGYLLALLAVAALAWRMPVRNSSPDPHRAMIVQIADLERSGIDRG
jgi:MFS family permease